MSGYGKDTNEFWLEITNRMYEAYDPKDIKDISALRVYICSG
jgi:hypothetical protein